MRLSGLTTIWDAGQLRRMPWGDSRTFEYNPAGTLKRRVDRMGRIAEFTYDHLDRRTQVAWYNAASTAPYVTMATTTQGSGSANEVQTVNVSNLTSGTFRLAFDGHTGLHCTSLSFRSRLRTWQFDWPNGQLGF